MKNVSRPLLVAGILAAGLVLTACASTTVQKTSSSAPAPYAGPPTESGLPLITQMQWAASKVRPDVVFMVGSCEDKTGQHKDAEALRYSTALTQACTDLLVNFARQAGFQVAERSPFNMSLIAQEYQLSHQFQVPQPGQPAGPPVNIGLIQRGGPNGGLTGANYMITGAVTTYSTSVQTSGGGVDLDGIGVTARSSEAIVGVTLRIVDVPSGLVVSSLYLQSTVVGNTSGFHFTRFIGSAVSTLATVTGGGSSATTVTRPNSDVHIASGEYGSSLQLPTDYALMDSIVANFARQIEVNWSLFYSEQPTFDYNVVPN